MTNTLELHLITFISYCVFYTKYINIYIILISTVDQLFNHVLYKKQLTFYEEVGLLMAILSIFYKIFKEYFLYSLYIIAIDYIDKQAGRHFCLASLTRKRRIFIRI